MTTIADSLVAIIVAHYGDFAGGATPAEIYNVLDYKTTPPFPQHTEQIAVWRPEPTARDPVNENYVDVVHTVNVRISTNASDDRLKEIVDEVRLIINARGNGVTGVTHQFVSEEDDQSVREDFHFIFELTARLEYDLIPAEAGYDGWDFDAVEHQHRNGFLNRTDSSIAFDTGTRTFTIDKTNGGFVVWQNGTKYTRTTEDTIVIADSVGIHVIYYDAGVLTVSVNPSHSAFDDIIVNRVLVAIIYWNATDNDDVIFGDERHGLIMDGETHHYLHDTRRAQYGSGFGLTDYILDTASDAALTFELGNGFFYDEDLEHEIIDGSAANQYEQQLSSGDAEIPIMYRDDVDGSWTEDAASTLPYKTAGSGRLAYNKDDGDGTFSQVEIANNKFVTLTLIATNDSSFPIKMIQGQTEYNTKVAALEGGSTEILAFGDFPTPETVILYRFIMQTNSGFGGTKKAKIIEVTDFRGSTIIGSAAIAQHHGSLGGLSDDDHSQYLLVDGTRASTGDQDFNEDINLNVNKRIYFDKDADRNNYIYAAVENQLNVIVEGTEMWRWFQSLVENRVPLRTIGDITPASDKDLDIGTTATKRFDNIYADDFVNESSFKKFDDPLKLVQAFKQSKDDPFELDNSLIDAWLKTRVKERDVIEFPVFDEKTGETSTSETLSKWTGKYRLKDGGCGNYADGYEDEDFEHEEGYSITKTQLILIQAIQKLEERIKVLEAE